jgi:Ni/Co efflux regulator RcnB
MRRKSFVLSVILASILAVPASFASTLAVQENQNANQDQNKRKLHVPQRGRRRHRDTRRHGIKQDYAGAGKSAGHGGKRFGKNIKHGKPVKAGKELGKGMGGMGKGVGHGTKRVGKKVGKKIKGAVTP